MSSAAGVALSPVLDDLVRSPASYMFNKLESHSNEAIVVFLTVDGSVIPLHILESDSIASVKLRIQTCGGIVVKQQKLIFGGRELARSNSLVKDYAIRDSDVVDLVLRLSDLLGITVRTADHKELEVRIDRYRNVGYLRKRIFRDGKAFVDLNEDHELLFNGEKLEDQRLINDIFKNIDDAVIHLVAKRSAQVRARHVEEDVELSVVASHIVDETNDGADEAKNNELQVVVTEKKTIQRDFWLNPVVISPKVEFPSIVSAVIKSTLDGLTSGKQPIQSSEGTGGAYFMLDGSGENYVSIFKPTDEEPNAVNNPRGLPVSSDGEGLKKGTRAGEGALREVAAYILDHPKSGSSHLSGEVIGFSGVPPTTMVECLHRGFHHPNGFDFRPENVKMGSLQMFVPNDGTCEDMGPQAFPVEDVHKISVLDMRLANADRHAGNILIHRGENHGRISLIPIDHGYCLPEKFEDCTFDWLYWPQSHQPYSSETIEYIKSLDAEQDIALLKFHGWDLPVAPARTLRIATMLLKKGVVERGMTPFAVGSMMCRETIHEESIIEKIVRKAEESHLPGMSESTFIETVSLVMDSHLDKLLA